MIIKIKKACKAKGVPEKYAERIQKTFAIDKEENIEGCVDLFKENILPAIQEAESGAKATAEEAAKKAAIEAYEKEHGLKDGKVVEKKPDVKLDGLDSNVKALIESQNAQITKLTEAVTGMNGMLVVMVAVVLY